MFENLKEQPADKILALMQAYREDDREQKIDLGVGVYKDASGNTPIMRAIKAAEKQLWEAETTKAYTGLAGDPGFADAMVKLVLGDAVPRETVAAAATPGGTGAVRQAFDLIRMANPKARVFVSDPTWPNHLSILKHMGIEFTSYRYFDNETRSVDFAGMIADLHQVMPGDVVLLHGCCHNPTGIDYSLSDWQEIADLLTEKGLLPILDLAYQGLGDGLEEDAKGVRLVLEAVPEALIAYSCDKNFGLYRDRVGAIYMMGNGADCLPRIASNGAALARANWSMPPDHGAAAVRTILEDKGLTAEWKDELESMRTRINQVRARLAEAGVAGSVDLRPLAHQRGLFAILPLSKDQIAAMRSDHAIYMAGSGRINIAGLTMGNIDKFIKALADVSA